MLTQRDAIPKTGARRMYGGYILCSLDHDSHPAEVHTCGVRRRPRARARRRTPLRIVPHTFSLSLSRVANTTTTNGQTIIPDLYEWSVVVHGQYG